MEIKRLSDKVNSIIDTLATEIGNANTKYQLELSTKEAKQGSIEASKSVANMRIKRTVEELVLELSTELEKDRVNPTTIARVREVINQRL